NLKAVNLSLGTRESQLTQTLMSNKLGALGVNTVYASGNMGDDLEDNPDMGGQNKSPYSICVGAYNPDGKAAIYSCYGQSSVDVYSTGSYILSTVPSFVPHYNEERQISSRSVYNLFFPETTNPSHLAGGKIEKFTDAPGVLFFDSCPIDEEGNTNPNAKELGSVNTQYGVDDKSSLAIRAWDLNVLYEDEEHTPPMMYSLNMVGRDLWMAVPIDSADKTDWISFRGTFDDNSHVYTGISGIMLSKSDSGAPVMRDMSVDNFLSGNINEYTDNPPVTPGIGTTSGSTFSKEAWQKVSLDLDAYVKEVNFFNTIYTDEIGETAMIKNVGNVSGVYEWNKDGKKYMIVEMGLLKGSRPSEDVASKDTNLLIDDIAVGDSHSACGPYSYMSGTSMASPSVVGCLAVIAKNEPANSTLDDTSLANEALERGAKLLASVDYDESLSTLCGTGGIVNLHDQTEFTKKAPLFTRADVDGNSLTLSGHFFGSNGTIEIDDAQATPEAWDDNSITVDLTGIRGGLHVAKVTNADGAINRVEFSTSRDVDGAVKLYENEYGLMVNDPNFFTDGTDCFVGNMVCCKGCLYTVSAGSSRQEAIALWKYDVKNKSWSRCADLPDLLKAMAVRSNSLSVYDGKVYIYEHDTKFGFKETTRPALFSYDPAKDKWTEIKPKGFGSPEKVFSFDGKLFAAYGYNDFRLINVKKKTMTKTKIKLNSLIEFASAVFAESEGKLYLFTEETNVDGSEYHPYFARMKYNSSKKQFTVTNLSKALKNLYSKDGNVFVVERDHTKLAGIPGGVALIKRPTSGNVHDTYIIKNSSSKVTTLEYTSCYHSVFDPLAAYYGGELYAMGISTFENDSMYFRSTHIRTNPLWATGKTATAKKSKKTTLPVKKTLKITGAQGTVSYAKKSGNKKISIAKKTGKITVKKGLKKGTYTVKIKVTAKGNKSYDARTVTATVKIKIK
ncbi:MAG: hypothetical protein IJL75_04215, partial [Eubacterium sp.]|nr:hypothetical protein [Eubacterium sp.]